MDAMPQRLIANDEDLIVNPERRLSCVILADKSSSMTGAPIDQLNRGLQVLHSEISRDSVAMKRVEVNVTSFGPVTVEQDFATVDQFRMPVLQPEEETPIGAAVLSALASIEARKAMYRAHGLSYYRSWIIMCTAVTDFAAGEDMIQLNRSVFGAIAAGARLQYVPDIVQYHYVDPLRLKLSYLLKKAFERSASVVRLSDEPVSSRFIPPYMIRKAAEHSLAATVSASRQMRRFHLVRAAASLGEIKGHLQARRDRRGRTRRDWPTRCPSRRSRPCG